MDTTNEHPWHAEGDGPEFAEGMTYGGDTQASDPWEVRFTRTDLPGSLITSWVYVKDHAMLNGEEDRIGKFLQVTVQTEFLICDDPADPGGTETWSDAFYADTERTWDDSDAALAAARTVARRIFTSWAPGWNGKPVYGYATMQALAPTP